MNRAILTGLGIFAITACGGEPASEQTKPATAVEANSTDEKSSGEDQPATPPTSEPSTEAVQSAAIDPEKTFKRACGICHSVADPETPKGKIQLAGPNLYGIYGADAARLENFAYSKAMKESGVVWDDASLDAYIERPSTFIRGNRMAYAGERNPEKRAAIIAYLKEQK